MLQKLVKATVADLLAVGVSFFLKSRAKTRHHTEKGNTSRQLKPDVAFKEQPGLKVAFTRHDTISKTRKRSCTEKKAEQ